MKPQRQVLTWLFALTVLGAGEQVLTRLTAHAAQQGPRAGNPIFPGKYADPEVHVFAGQYWIFPTYSAPYNEQTFMDAFSSRDLITWEKHSRVLDTTNVSWARRALWAPSIVQKDGWYYLFFGANDIQNDQQIGGIGVARSRQPEGPFIDHLGKPLIDKFHNGAQPIDQFAHPPLAPLREWGRFCSRIPPVATGAGHHSVLHSPASDKWYIVYHRRPLGQTDRNNRVVSIDEMRFDERGYILPVKITNAGVLADPLRR